MPDVRKHLLERDRGSVHLLEEICTARIQLQPYLVFGDQMSNTRLNLRLLQYRRVGEQHNLEERKLSTIYQFVRGLPLLYVEIRLRKELEDIEVAESQLEEEGLQEEYLQHKLLLQERKESIMRKLSGKLEQS